MTKGSKGSADPFDPLVNPTALFICYHCQEVKA